MSEVSKESKPAEETKVAGDTAAESQPSEAQSPPPKEMRVILLNGFGGLKNLKVLKKPQPTVAKDNVLISVKACGLNFGDLMVRQGVVDNVSKPPFIMGTECAGVIEEVGEGVEGLKVGDRVYAFVDSKGWAEYVLAPANCVYKIPAKMSFQDAVAITLNFVVAQALLHDVANLRSGQTVLIHSIGGGVGQALTQLAKKVPDVTVVGTASKHKHEQLKDQVNHLLEHNNDYNSEVKKVAPDGFDVILDCMSGGDGSIGYNLLKPMGRYVLYGIFKTSVWDTKNLIKSWFQVTKISPTKLYDENKTLAGFNLRRLLFQQNQHDYVRALVEKVYKMYSEDSIKPTVDSTFAFEDIADAMQKLHDRKNIGKVVLDPAAEPMPRPVEEEKENTKSKRKSSAKEEKKADDKKEAPATNGDASGEKEGTKKEEGAKEGSK